MKRNKKRAAVGILLAGIAGFLAYSFYLQPDLLKFLPNSAANRAEEAAMGGNAAPAPTSLMMSSDTPKKIYAEGESVSFGIVGPNEEKGTKITGAVNSSAASKQMPVFLKDRTIEYKGDEKADENGTLTSPHSYVTIQVTLKSEGAEIHELNICFNIMPLGENNQVDRLRPLTQLIDHDHAPKADTKMRDYVDLKPNQEETYTLYYILPDTDVEQQLYLRADCEGSTNYNAINFIRLSMNRQG